MLDAIGLVTFEARDHRKGRTGMNQPGRAYRNSRPGAGWPTAVAVGEGIEIEEHWGRPLQTVPMPF